MARYSGTGKGKWHGRFLRIANAPFYFLTSILVVLTGVQDTFVGYLGIVETLPPELGDLGIHWLADFVGIWAIVAGLLMIAGITAPGMYARARHEAAGLWLALGWGIATTALYIGGGIANINTIGWSIPVTIAIALRIWYIHRIDAKGYHNE
jgi:hypothetical protein